MVNKGRNLTIMIITVALALAGLLTLLGQSWKDNTLQAINNLDSRDVLSVKGRVFPLESFPSASTEFQDISEHKELLLGLLSPATTFNTTGGSYYQRIAELRFEKRDGTILTVYALLFGKGRLLFANSSSRCYMRQGLPTPAGKDNGRDVFRDESLLLYGFICAIAAQDKRQISEYSLGLAKSLGNATQ